MSFGISAMLFLRAQKQRQNFSNQLILSAWNSQIEEINSSNGKPQNQIGRANILKCNAQFKVASTTYYFCVMFSEHLWNTAEFSWDRPRSKMEGQGFGCSIQHPKSMLSSGLVSNYCLLAKNKALNMFTIKTMQAFLKKGKKYEDWVQDHIWGIL